MNSNQFRRLRPLACVSPAQTAQPLLPALRPLPPPKRTTEGVATKCSVGTTKLPPLPPPRRNFEGVVTMCSAERTGLRPHPPPRRTTEEFEKLMKEFTKSRFPSEPSVRLPSVLEPSRGRYRSTFTYGVSAQRFQADLLREWGYNKFLEQEREKDLRNAAKQVSQEKSAPTKTELKGENDWADFMLNFNTCSEALKATKKVSEPKIKREEVDLTGESEEGNGNPEEMDSEVMDLKESVLWEYTEIKMEMNEQEKDLKLRQDKNEELKQEVERIRERILKTENVIEKKKEKLKMKSSSQANRKRIFLYEKLAEVHKQCFDRFCCPDFVSVMLQDFDEWFSDWLARVPAETLGRKQRFFAKRFMYRRGGQSQAELEALREERRQRRRQRALEIALAPPVKISGRKLMPRSPPPKKVIKKEEPLAAKNQW